MGCSPEVLEAVVNTSDVGVLLQDARGIIVLWNTWMADASGIPRERAVGSTLEELFPEIAETRLAGALCGARKQGVASLLSPSLHGAPLPLRGDGPEHRGFDRMQQYISVKPITLGPGARHCLVQVTDVTGIAGRERLLREQASSLRKLSGELEHRAQDLARSNADLEEFAHVASHDLQEPLRMVASYVQLLERRYADRLDADARKYIQYAVDGAARMKALITDLLALSRIATRGEELTSTDAAVVLGEALANLQAAIEDCDAVISWDDLPPVLADASQIRQLFQNIVGNAIKYRGDARPEIHVGCKRRGTQWLFRIHDNGIGMDPQFRERIFVMFQRLHTRDEYPGTGIGLALCKKIVDRHGGAIWVETEPGSGSTFYFSLPAVDPDEKEDASQATEGPAA